MNCALVTCFSGWTTASTSPTRSRASSSVNPTPAISGSVKTAVGRWSYSAGRVGPPNMSATAIRPWYCATGVNWMPVTSPAAQTPAAEVRKYSSTSIARGV